MPRPLLVRERASLGAPSQNCSSSGEVGMVRGETSAMPRGELGASMLQRLFCMADILHSYRVIDFFFNKSAVHNVSKQRPSAVQNVSKQRPSTVQACPNTPFFCPSLENTLAEILQFTAWPRPSFPTNWPFYNIKRRDDSHASASEPQASGRRARVSPFLEFYLRLVRCWRVPRSKSRQQPAPHCFSEG